MHHLRTVKHISFIFGTRLGTNKMNIYAKLQHYILNCLGVINLFVKDTYRQTKTNFTTTILSLCLGLYSL